MAADTAHLIAVARGAAAPDLVISGARVFSAFTQEWLEGDVAIAGGHVAGIGDYPEAARRIDADGRWLVPGFIDAHVHVESSKLTPARFAEAVLPHGTTAIVAEPHEVANVLGADGVRWFLEASHGLPLPMYVMAPSCVPASSFESPGGSFDQGDIEQVLEHPRVLGVGEMMNFPAVIAGEPGELAKLAAPGSSHADGHAPGVRGRQLDAYVAAGIRSDHESTTWQEALDKRRRGMWVLLREASNARDLVDLLPMVRDHGPAFCAFCTDDREPDFLLRHGHVNQMCRVAVAAGISPEAALVMATLHPAMAHGIDRLGHGAIAPGWRADLCLLPDLERFEPELVLVAGQEVARNGTAAPVAQPTTPRSVRDTVNVAATSLHSSAFAVPAPAGAPGGNAAGRVPVRVIGVVDGQLLTRSLVESVPSSDGLLHADPDADIASIAVVERHRATGRIGRGFVHGFGLRRGAIASTVAHDAHNVVVVGVDSTSMATCVARLEALGGGIVVCDGDHVLAELALPVAGLMSDEPIDVVAAGMDATHAAAESCGVALDAPFMALSFLALSVIPSLKLTDRGLVDVERFQLVPLVVAADGTPPSMSQLLLSVSQ